jgi:hypothetical protein
VDKLYVETVAEMGIVYFKAMGHSWRTWSVNVIRGGGVQHAYHEWEMFPPDVVFDIIQNTVWLCINTRES